MRVVVLGRGVERRGTGGGGGAWRWRLGLLDIAIVFVLQKSNVKQIMPSSHAPVVLSSHSTLTGGSLDNGLNPRLCTRLYVANIL